MDKLVAAFAKSCGRKSRLIRRALARASLSCLVFLPCAFAEAVPTHHWTFEGEGGTPGDTGTWWRDKTGDQDFSVPTGALDPEQVALPDTGPGAVFPNPVPRSGTTNRNVADMKGANAKLWIPASDTAWNRDSFTIEGFFNVSELQGTGYGLVRLVEPGTFDSQFLLQTRDDGGLRAVVYNPSDGSWPAPPGRPIAFEGMIEPGKDYYLAVSVSTGVSAEERFVTFYAQNLSDGGPLRRETVSLPAEYTALFKGNLQLRLNESATINVTDELRYSDGVLENSDLLVGGRAEALETGDELFPTVSTRWEVGEAPLRLEAIRPGGAASILADAAELHVVDGGTGVVLTPQVKTRWGEARGAGMDVAYDGGLDAVHRLEAVDGSGMIRWEIDLKNGAEVERWVEVRVVLSTVWDNAPEFFDGVEDAVLSDGPKERMSVGEGGSTRPTPFPAVQLSNGELALALGLEPDTITSFHGGRGDSEGGLAYISRHALLPGQEQTVSFVLYLQEAHEGGDDAIHGYYRRFPESFEVRGDADPRVADFRGTVGGAYALYPAIREREDWLSGTGSRWISWQWGHSQYKRAGDWYARQELWDWQPPEGHIGDRNPQTLLEMEDRDKFHAERRERFLGNDHRANIHTGYYLLDWMEQDLVESKGWLDQIYASPSRGSRLKGWGHMGYGFTHGPFFPWASAWTETVRADLPLLLEDLQFGSINLDLFQGRGMLRHDLPEPMQGWAFGNPTPPDTTPELPESLQTGLVGHWDFREGAGEVLHDRSENGRHGTIAGPQWVWMGDTHALEFRRNGDEVVFGGEDDFDLRDEVTMSAWVFRKMDPKEHPERIFGKSNAAFQISDGQWRGYQLFVDWFQQASHQPPRLPGTQAQSPYGVWHHVTASFDGQTARLYRNGQLEVEEPASKSRIPSISRPLKMGGSGFRGRISDARIYDRVLSASEVEALYTEFAHLYKPLPKERFILSGVGYRKFIEEEIHSRSVGPYRLATVVNGTEPPFVHGFLPDAYLEEANISNPFVFPYRNESSMKNRVMAGHKPIYTWNRWNNTPIGKVVPWEDLTGDQIRLIYQLHQEDWLLFLLHYGIIPDAEVLQGHELLTDAMPLLLDVQSRGWEPVSGLGKPDERLWLRRYGASLNAAVVVAKPADTRRLFTGDDRFEGELTFLSRYLGPFEALPAPYADASMNFRSANRKTSFAADLGPRDYEVIIFPVGIETESSVDLEGQSETERTVDRIRHAFAFTSPKSFSGKLRLKAPRDFLIREIKVNGEPAEVGEHSFTEGSNHISVVFESSIFRSPERKFLEANYANRRLQLPDSDDPRIAGIGEMIREYFRVREPDGLLHLGEGESDEDLQSPPGEPEGVRHYWTFEGEDGDIGESGAWWRDKIVNEDLGGGTAGTVGRQTLPATGAGSAFPDPVPQTESSNRNAMDVSAGWSRTAGTSAFNGRESFTVEGMFNITDTSGNQPLISIRGGENQNQFQAAVNNGELIGFAYDSDGSFITSVKPGLNVDADTDYYFAVSASAGTDMADRFMTFWLRDLTNDGALRNETISLADEEGYASLYQSSDLHLRVGESNNLTVMDEVRYSEGILAQGQLLVGEPSQFTLLLDPEASAEQRGVFYDSITGEIRIRERSAFELQQSVWRFLRLLDRHYRGFQGWARVRNSSLDMMLQAGLPGADPENNLAGTALRLSPEEKEAIELPDDLDTRLNFEEAGLARFGETILVSAPRIIPDGGVFKDSVSVAVEGSEGADLYFTFGQPGGDPAEDGVLYGGPFLLDSGGTVRVVAARDGVLSAETSARFHSLDQLLGNHRLRVKPDGANGMWLTLENAGVGLAYELQASGDLKNWSTLRSPETASSEIMEWWVEMTDEDERQFYRVVLREELL